MSETSARAPEEKRKPNESVRIDESVVNARAEIVDYERLIGAVSAGVRAFCLRLHPEEEAPTATVAEMTAFWVAVQLSTKMAMEEEASSVRRKEANA